MNEKKLIKARIDIDKVDKRIFNLIKRRTKIVRYMLNLKKYKKEIVDHKRINIILSKIRRDSIKNNIDPKITSRIWKSMIWSYVNFQRKNFKRK
jgi:chorismate mutase